MPTKVMTFTRCAERTTWPWMPVGKRDSTVSWTALARQLPV
jgi:hypothetical protein